MDIKRAQERKLAGETFDFDAAAQRRAEDAAREPETAADEFTPAARPRQQGSIFHRHRLRVLAAAGGRVLAASGATAPTEAANDEPLSPEEAAVRLLLIDHQRSLKLIESREAKIALKREILPQYEAWVDGLLQGNAGDPGEVLATVLIWRLDAGLFIEAVPLIDYLLRHRLPLPAHIKRTPATFITEEIAKAALAAFDQGGDVAEAFPVGVLAALEQLIDHEDPALRQDMPDEVRAKLQKAIARAILRDGEDDRTRQQEALKRFLRALELDAGCGVKKDIDTLQRKLNKPAPAPTPTPPAPEGAG